MHTDRPLTALLTLGFDRGGHGALLSEGGRPPTVGELDLARMLETRDRLPRLLSPPGGLLIPGDDAGAVRHEREAGGLMARLLLESGMRAISDRLGHLEGRAEAHGQQLVLLIDARTPLTRELPWELLEALPPGAFPGAGCRVTRVVEGHAAQLPPRAAQLEVALWIPDEQDRICRAVADELERNLTGLPHTSLVTGMLDFSAPPPGVYRVVHVICHGEEKLGQVLLQAGQGRSLATDTALRWLGPALEGVGLVILDVCEGGSVQVDPIDAPASRLVKSGVPACIAPRSPLSADASSLFSAALYRALAGGESLTGALHEGRRALSAMGLAHPSCRWWMPVLVVSDEQVVAGPPPVAASGVLYGWPQAAPDAERLILEAGELARAQGFLGIEHVALALSRWKQPSPLIALLQQPLADIGRDLGGFGLDPSASPVPTPRLRTLTGRLREGFTPDDLVRTLAAVPWVAERLPPHVAGQLGGSTPRRETLQIESQEIQRRASIRGVRELSLEVLGGPEDGRFLRLSTSGDYLGRWDPERPTEPATRLYVGDVPFDQTVSRSHLRCIGAWRIEVLGPTRIQRAGSVIGPLKGVVRVQVGDVLLLGAATRVRVMDPLETPAAV